jgi:glycosyltransferase involved in cell wall biosynthesis
MKAYNHAYNYAIDKARGDAVWFLHPDMIVTNPEAIPKVSEGHLAWWTQITSYARDMQTEILQGRASRWKNIHAKQFGLHYYGGYGSTNEDFYHGGITGKAYRHHGQDFTEYPFNVVNSGIMVDHYCELKSYERRFEKMKRCLKTQHPYLEDARIEELAKRHPRVSLETQGKTFGHFEFGPSSLPVPAVFEKYGAEFMAFKKEPVHG